MPSARRPKSRIMAGVAKGDMKVAKTPTFMMLLLLFHRMGLETLLVHLDAPSRPLGQEVVAVVEHRWLVDDLVAPRDAVDVDLHDAEVRHRGGEMRADGARQMAVEVVRRHVDLV